MKTRWMAVIASGLITSVPVLTVPALTAVAQAETNALTQLFPALAGVQLTPVQLTQLDSLSHQILPQVQNLLAAEQQAQFSAALAQGAGVRVAASSLNLSVTQRLQIFNILQTARSQVNTILTPEQQQQVQQNVQALQQQGH